MKLFRKHTLARTGSPILLAGLLALTPAFTGCATDGGIMDSLTSIHTGHETTDNVLRGIGLGSKVAAAATDITPQEEYYIGRAVAADLLERYPLLEHDTATRYVNLVGQSVAQQSQVSPYEGYRFAILESVSINAFAAPGAYIFITTGMLRQLQSEDELAAVLAHEIAHIEHRHAVGAIKGQRLTDAARAVGDEAANHITDADTIRLRNAFGDAVGDITQTLILKGYSRDQELAADQTAVALLNRTGYDAAALSRVLERIESAMGTTHNLDLTRSHPGVDERIRKVASLTQEAGRDASALDARQARFQEALKDVLQR